MSLAVPADACQAARECAGQRFLSRDAPELPLAGCTRAGSCQCRFRKHVDRRGGEDRRLLGAGETARWYAGTERRTKGRRGGR